jgi:hypothetical protein
MAEKTSDRTNGAGVKLALKLGDKVRILRSQGLQGRIVELRGPLGPGGAEIFRVRVWRKPKPHDIEVRADQLEAIPAGN